LAGVAAVVVVLVAVVLPAGVQMKVLTHRPHEALATAAAAAAAIAAPAALVPHASTAAAVEIAPVAAPALPEPFPSEPQFPHSATADTLGWQWVEEKRTIAPGAPPPPPPPPGTQPVAAPGHYPAPDAEFDLVLVAHHIPGQPLPQQVLVCHLPLLVLLMVLVLLDSPLLLDLLLLHILHHPQLQQGQEYPVGCL
jgi:hypothetical protein